MTKPRSDSKLFTLPAEDQIQIFEWMKHSSYKVVRTQIRKKYSINISEAALSNAWDKWSREEFSERVLKSKGLAADVIAQITDGDMVKLDRATQAALQQTAFELSITNADPKTVKSFYTLLLKARSLDLDQQKVELQERRLRQAEEAEAAVKDESLTPEAREKRMKEIFFG